MDGWSRRTTSIDIAWRAADPRGVVLRLTGRAEDTASAGTTIRAGVEAGLDARSELVELTLVPARDAAGTAALLGAPVRSGFRARAAAAFPGDAHTPLGQLLDDLPVATLIAGYATVREQAREGRGFDAAGVPARMRDLCSGWRAGGTLLRSVEAGRGVPLQACPPAPPSALPPLPAGDMRRQREIEVTPAADAVHAAAMFRDVYAEPAGTEVVLHEYSVRVVLDRDLVVRDVEATPHVLPYDECPAAAAHVADLRGLAAEDLGREVARRLAGTRSCTHLNDLLRSLTGLPHLTALAVA